MVPDFAVAYYSRGLVYRNRGETEKAIADFQKTVELAGSDGLGDLAQDQIGELGG
jgi:tetratricopeptide (TPR) repeat protein